MKYLMSEKTAQFVRGMMEQANTPKSVATGAARRVTPSDVVEDSFAHPFELRWAASSGEGGGGAWIIWLPPGSLVTDGTEASTADLTAAAGYPAGWYDLTSIFGESEIPETFDLFLDVGEKYKFELERTAASNPVLVASVTGKMVKGIVRSALVATPDDPHPWELRRFYDDPETEGGESVPVWRVWIPKAALLFIWGKVTEDVVLDAETLEPVYVQQAPAAASWGCDNYGGEIDAERTEAAVARGLQGVWACVAPGESGELFVHIEAGDPPILASASVTITGTAPQDSTVSHPSGMGNGGGFYIRLAGVSSAGVVTQYMSSLTTITSFWGKTTVYELVGGDGILVSRTGAGRFTISLKDPGGSGGSGGGGSEDDAGGTECVTSLNGGTGAMTVIGGEGISVAIKEGVITITNTKPCNCKEGETEDAPIPSDPCGHPESAEEGGEGEYDGSVGPAGATGGVLAPGDSSEGGGIYGPGGDTPDWHAVGGVSGGGDTHSGSNDCCTD